MISKYMRTSCVLYSFGYCSVLADLIFRAHVHYCLHIYVCVTYTHCIYTCMCYIHTLYMYMHVSHTNFLYVHVCVTYTHCICTCMCHIHTMYMYMYVSHTHTVDVHACVTYTHCICTCMCHIQTLYIRGVPRNWEGGGRQEFFFSDLGSALLGGFGGMLPREIFLSGVIWCVLGCILIRFCLYFFRKITIFYIKNKYFRYTLAMRYFS